MITQEKLKELVIYNYQTGVFRFKNICNFRKTLEFPKKTDKKGYLNVRIKGKSYKVHRLVWIYIYGSISDDAQIDHINHIKTDNRIENLRLDYDGCINQANKPKRKDCTTGYIGVNWNKSKNKYVARLQFYGKRKDIKYGNTAHEVAKAREKFIIDNNLPHTRNFI